MRIACEGGAKVESGHIHARFFLQGSMGFAQPTSPAPAAGHCVATSVGRPILVLRKEGVGSSLTDLIRPPYLRTHKSSSSSSFSSPAFISLAWRKERISNRPSPLTSCYVPVTLLCASTFFGGRGRGIYFAGNSKKRRQKRRGFLFLERKTSPGRRRMSVASLATTERRQHQKPSLLLLLVLRYGGGGLSPRLHPLLFFALADRTIYHGEGVSSPPPPPFPGKWKKRWGRV